MRKKRPVEVRMLKPVRFQGLLGLIGFLLSWEFIGHRAFAARVLPSISAILGQLWLDRSDYAEHVPATLKIAALGFCLGNIAAIALAIAFTRIRTLDRIFQGMFVSIFSTPLLILVLIVDGSVSNRSVGALIFTSLTVFFPTLESVKVGLLSSDIALIDVVRALGGRFWEEFKQVRVRSALPSLGAALQVAFPVAILGAMLSDFTGAESGLGKYLIGSLGQARPERLWGISLVSSLIAATGYIAFSSLAAKWTAESVSEKLHASNADLDGKAKSISGMGTVLATVSSMILLPLFAWQLYAWFFSGRISSKGPVEVCKYLFGRNGPSEGFRELIEALPASLGVALTGLMISIIAAFLLAVLSTLNNNVEKISYPVAMVTQSVPIIAWIPVLKLFAGKGLLLTILVTVSVSFFPGFVLLSRGLSQVPKEFLDIMNSYRSSRLQILRLVRLPVSMPYLLAAIRLTAPRVLLGVILAEYLVTSVGLGRLIYNARGAVDFSMLWAVAWITATISGLFYLIAKGLSSLFGANDVGVSL